MGRERDPNSSFPSSYSSSSSSSTRQSFPPFTSQSFLEVRDEPGTSRHRDLTDGGGSNNGSFASCAERRSRERSESVTSLPTPPVQKFLGTRKTSPKEHASPCKLSPLFDYLLGASSYASHQCVIIVHGLPSSLAT
ncbi:hypothetical protein LZ31DRAFT_15031 [Colletotrichum somersetense]|nr:hypothetical protein LZ31DRAFT_15031 [Colletotrichum somersetense]